MNFDPTKYCYSILPATPFTGVNVVLVRLETKQIKVFYIANQSTTSVGLISHMDSMTDDLFLDYFEKQKKPKVKNPDGRKQKNK